MVRFSRRCAEFHVSGNQFDIEDAILKALEGLQVDLQINSSVALDECEALLCVPCSCATPNCEPDAIDLAFVQQQVTVNVSG